MRKGARRFTIGAVVAATGLLAPILSPSSAAGAQPVFGTPVQVGTGGTEPGIVVGPNGAIYVNAPDGILSNGLSPSFVFRSTDNGATWALTPPGLRGDLPGGGDSQLLVDPVNGNLAMIDLWLGDSTASTSTNGGSTWLAEPLGGPPVQDRPWIAESSGGTVYEVTHVLPVGLIVSKSIDGGLLYTPNGVAATVDDQTGCVCPPGNIIAEGSGGLVGSDKVGVIYATSTGGVNFARSTNGGLTFTQEAVQGASSNTTNANFPVVANGGGGHLYAVWLNETGTASVVAYSQSTDWGATWSAPVALVSAGTSVYPWVAAHGNKVAVSVYNTPAASATPDAVPATGQWFESALESTDGGATFSALTTADPVAAKMGPVCTGGANCSANRELGDFQTVTLDNSGNLDLAYDRVPSPGISNIEFVQGT